MTAPVLIMLAAGAFTALVLACAVILAYWQPAPRRAGFAVRYEHRPVRRNR
ncbi:hypothetical protein LB566_23315 [Mesorhizobium sp. CA13]|uniref:hypothetical protein n=1 Tax=Mesorhizobium sp. CA13 TaxID=2876643 RepID=UPI001CCB70BA|nr:hypothetical protein [Mesorhizobium sp. CA13]MBZ9856725.1 hypothetical protein [Mesorhizobium sp. CA13]